MSDLGSKDISIFVSRQTVEGEIDSNPVFDKFTRRTSGKSKLSPTYVTSNEIKNNGQPPQQIKDKTELSAAFESEVNQQSAKYIDDLIHGVQVDNSVSAATTIASTATGFTDSGNGFTNLSVDDWIFVGGMVATENNKSYKISVKNNDGDIETYEVPPVVESAGASVTMDSQKTAAGTSRQFYTTQNRTFDASKVSDTAFHTFFDATPNTGTITVGPSGIVTLTMDMVVSDFVTGTAIISGQTDSAEDTSHVISAVNDIGSIYVDGVFSDCEARSIEYAIDNGYEGDGGAAGCDGERFSRKGIAITGAVVTQADRNNTFKWQDKFENSTRIAFATEFTWDDGRWMIVEVTRALLTEHDLPPGNIIISNEMVYQAEESPSTGNAMQVFRNF